MLHSTLDYIKLSGIRIHLFIHNERRIPFQSINLEKVHTHHN